MRVEAERNEQLVIYASAALNEYGLLADFKRVRLVIVQPRLDHISEWDIPIAAQDEEDSLGAFIARSKPAAERALQFIDKPVHEVAVNDLKAGEKQCRFCKAKATCPALTSHVLSTIADDFVDISQSVSPQIKHAIAARTFSNDTLCHLLLGAVDLIESWCKAIRARVKADLLSGYPVPGFKLVEGRRGARRWSNDSEVATVFKSMRLKTEQMYDLSLISPTAAEKLHKAGDIGPRQWPKLQALITQSNGEPSVAPESDKRPALVNQAAINDFANVASETGEEQI